MYLCIYMHTHAHRRCCSTCHIQTKSQETETQHTYMHTHTHIHTHTHVHRGCWGTCQLQTNFTGRNVVVHTHTHTHSLTHACMHARTHAHKCTGDVAAHATFKLNHKRQKHNIHTCIHAYAHTHTHTCAQVMLRHMPPSSWILETGNSWAAGLFDLKAEQKQNLASL